MNQSQDEIRQLALLELIYSGISDPDYEKLKIIEEVYKRAHDPIEEFNARLGEVTGDPRLGEVLNEFRKHGYPEVTLNFIGSLDDQGWGTQPSMASFLVFVQTSWRFYAMVPRDVQKEVLSKYFKVTVDSYTRRYIVREKAAAQTRTKKKKKKGPVKKKKTARR